MTNVRVGLYSLGCKVNYAEGSAICNQLEPLGCEIVDFNDLADIYIINTCTVTQVADKKSRAIIRQAHRRNPQAVIAVIGCMSQLKPDETAEIGGVKVVLGSSNKFSIVDIVRKYMQNMALPVIKDNKETSIFMDAYSSVSRTRTFLKIQDGCDYFCHYCTVPHARGASRSDSIAHVIANIKKIEDLGVKEVVLTGVNIGDFGKNTGESLALLLNKVAKETAIPRIRISSIEPDLISNEIIDIMASNACFMPHLHIPLQAATDEVLQLMGRRYPLQLFNDRMAAIHSKIPNACIAVDIICGFPGETAALFEASLAFVEQLHIAYLHVFTYSEREGTKAADFKGQLPVQERRERSTRMQELSDSKKKRFLEDNVGRLEEVLWESEDIHGYMQGFTRNYLRAQRVYELGKVNTIEAVRLMRIANGGIMDTN